MLPNTTFSHTKVSALTSTNAMQINKKSQQLPEIVTTPISIDPQHQQVFNAKHISNRLIPEIKKSFKEHNLEMKPLFQLRHEFSRHDIYAFSFSNDKELKFFIESLNITGLPENFVRYMYLGIVNPFTKKINYLLLKQFIDVCQDQ